MPIREAGRFLRDKHTGEVRRRQVEPAPPAAAETEPTLRQAQEDTSRPARATRKGKE